MNLNKNQIELPPGSELDRITPETQFCPTKKVPCNYWTEDFCRMDVCWMEKQQKSAMNVS